ncbi:cytochrome C [Comamonadaceae bacterium OH2545_COT-014]|nr:cytochrome C [Comamonadaceae bacterium OH2545_COT-014]
MKAFATLAAGLIAAAVALPASASPEAAIHRAGCMACHAKGRKMIGPSFRDIAARYKGRKDSMRHLMNTVRRGGAGVYGPVPMPPTTADKISDADLQAAVAFILNS